MCIEVSLYQIRKLQDKDIFLLLENNTRGEISSVMGDRYVKTDLKKISYVDAKSLYGHSMSQPMPYDEIKNNRNVKLEEILKTTDDSDIVYFIEVDLKYPD